jgi:hypothetical protein
MYIKMEIDDACKQCEHYWYIPAKLYLKNGDPGYPAEDICALEWVCPRFECTEECEDCAVSSNCADELQS